MITTINNQPIRFRTEDEINDSCECLGQSYCQLINVNDITQFQIRSINSIVDGAVWNIFEAINLTFTLTNETGEGECDGEVIVNASGGAPPYTYSINGGAYQSGNTFTGLCAGVHTVIVLDSVGNEGSGSFAILTNVVCGNYAGSTIQTLINDGILLGQLYNCTLGDLQ